MKEDWMEGYINKLMRMIINKMKWYLKDDQLGFKYSVPVIIAQGK